MSLSRARITALPSGDKEAYKTSRERLKAGNKEAKWRHQQRQKRDHDTSNTKDMLQVILNFTSYKSKDHLYHM